MRTKKFTWEDISKLINKIANEVKNDFNPDVIIAIQRGGFIPAVYLSHLLNVRDIRPLNIIRTKDDKVMSEKIIPIIKNKMVLNGIRGKNVLIVDDIVGSGESLKIVQKIILSKKPKEIKKAIILINEINLNKTKDKPIVNYIGKRIKAWAIFPWEK